MWEQPAGGSWGVARPAYVSICSSGWKVQQNLQARIWSLGFWFVTSRKTAQQIILPHWACEPVALGVTISHMLCPVPIYSAHGRDGSQPFLLGLTLSVSSSVQQANVALAAE